MNFNNLFKNEVTYKLFAYNSYIHVHRKKVKQKKDICLMVCLFANVFQLLVFVWRQKYSFKIIFVWGIIMRYIYSFYSVGSLHHGL